MYITEQYMMYHMADRLVQNEKYDIIHLNTRENEIWLAKTKRRKTKVIRLLQRGFDWKNHLKADITSVFKRVGAMRQYFAGKQIEIYNVYISALEPVDEWEMLKKPLQLNEKNPLKMKVFYITEESWKTEQTRLLQEVNSHQLFDSEIPTVNEQERLVSQTKTTFTQTIYEKNKQYKDVFTYGKPRFTFWLIYVNLFMFFLLELNGGSTNIDTLVQFGAKYNPAIISGEWWRIISSMFLHIGLIHLLMNMLALYYLGMAVERIFGSRRFFIIYFLAGIGGGLTSFAFNISISAGASGALFGLFGALLFFGSVYKQLFAQTMGKNIIVILVINLFIGFLVPQIDMGAHLGGLIAGYLAACIVFVPNKRNVLVQVLGSIVYIAALLFLIYYGILFNVGVIQFT